MYLEWKREWTVPTIVGVVSFGAGVGVGYAINYLKNKKAMDEIQEILEQVEYDTNQLELDLTDRIQRPFFIQDEEVREASRAYHPSMENFNQELAESELNPEEEIEPEMNHVFGHEVVENDETWDYVEEEKTRSSDKPYIIHRDEYFGDNADKDYSQTTLTYYQGDDILTDEHDTPIYNAHTIAGPLTFGKGSGDPNVVYIRNERLEAEYEVLLDHGHYAVEILGQEMEHSFDNRKAPLPKFRDD